MDKKKMSAANEAFMSKAKGVWSKYAADGADDVDGWDIKEALKEMGHSVSAEMIFDMIRVGEVEHSTVNFDRFLQMCDTNYSSEGITRGKRRNQGNVELLQAWEALGGKVDLTGEVDALALRQLFDFFELRTNIDEITSPVSPAGTLGSPDPSANMLEYGEFCALLENDPIEEANRKRNIDTPDMRKPFADLLPELKIESVRDGVKKGLRVALSATFDGVDISPRERGKRGSITTSPRQPLNNTR